MLGKPRSLVAEGSAAQRKRKRDGTETQDETHMRRKKLTEPSSAQVQKAVEVAPETDIANNPNRPEKNLDASKENGRSREADAICHWATHGTWPEDFSDVRSATSSRSVRSGLSQGRTSKRTSESSEPSESSELKHRSDELERMAINGVFMKSSARVKSSRKIVCESLLKGNRTPSRFPFFPEVKLNEVLERIHDLNAARIQRDVTPWVVPSAEDLFYHGDSELDYIGDDFQVEWTRCATMGSTRPKPSYTAGFLRKAFTSDEIHKLQNYASPARPVFFTPYLCFPFLICEVKSGEYGLDQANRQNIHSGSIAVRALFELYRAAFGEADPRVEELYGEILVFTISHDSHRADLYGHYALAKEGSAGELEFYRDDIGICGLSQGYTANRYKPYNFVRNVYDKFVPEHLKRIKFAAAQLPAPGITAAGLSSTPSRLDTESDAPANSQNASLAIEQMEERENTLREQMEKLLAESRARQKAMMEQMEESEKVMRAQMEEREKAMMEQMEESDKVMRAQMEEREKAMMEQLAERERRR